MQEAPRNLKTVIVQITLTAKMLKMKRKNLCQCTVMHRLILEHWTFDKTCVRKTGFYISDAFDFSGSVNLSETGTCVIDKALGEKPASD